MIAFLKSLETCLKCLFLFMCSEVQLLPSLLFLLLRETTLLKPTKDTILPEKKVPTTLP